MLVMPNISHMQLNHTIVGAIAAMYTDNLYKAGFNYISASFNNF